jgi:uncharacterized membrane protein
MRARAGTQDAVIAGTPAAGTAGTYPVTITATSSSGRATGDLTLTITITAAHRLLLTLP